MTEVEALELGREAVGCVGWRWLPGMRYLDPDGSAGRLGDAVLPAAWGFSRWCVPDLRDPCTAGGLLALVREAWGFPVYCRLRDSGNWECCVPASLLGVTEAHALVSAIRAAPRSTP